jgi:hypothetical protein
MAYGPQVLAAPFICRGQVDHFLITVAQYRDLNSITPSGKWHLMPE